MHLVRKGLDWSDKKFVLVQHREGKRLEQEFQRQNSNLASQ